MVACSECFFKNLLQQKIAFLFSLKTYLLSRAIILSPYVKPQLLFCRRVIVICDSLLLSAMFSYCSVAFPDL